MPAPMWACVHGYACAWLRGCVAAWLRACVHVSGGNFPSLTEYRVKSEMYPAQTCPHATLTPTHNLRGVFRHVVSACVGVGHLHTPIIVSLNQDGWQSLGSNAP